MKQLSLREIQLEELNILLAVDKACKENEIRYTLVGGTMLGAVRHGGFIPWDDDIDIGMARPDYERFFDLLEKNKNLLPQKYGYISDRDENACFPFLKVIDRTIKIHSPKGDPTGNLWIDIFPLDGYPAPTEEKESKRFNQKLRLCRTRLLYCYEPMKGKKLQNKIFGYCSKLLGAKSALRALKKEAEKYPYADCDYAGNSLWGLYGLGERYPKSDLETTETVKFEGYDLPIMSHWESYLTGIYGDYMQLPPEEKRYCHMLDARKEEDRA